jgi:hypothetical protein
LFSCHGSPHLLLCRQQMKILQMQKLFQPSELWRVMFWYCVTTYKSMKKILKDYTH